MKTCRIGITGTMASGKSEVRLYLQKLGFSVFDADAVSRELMETESMQTQCIEHFGTNICTQEGTVDRKKLAAAVFDSPEQKKWLEDIMHPAVKERMLQDWKNHAHEQFWFAEVPLLFEAGWEDLFEEIWTAAVSNDEAVKRCIKNRGYTEEQAMQRLRTQMNPQQQIVQSSKVFYNNGTIQQLHEQIDSTLNELKVRYRDGA